MANLKFLLLSSLVLIFTEIQGGSNFKHESMSRNITKGVIADFSNERENDGYKSIDTENLPLYQDFSHILVDPVKSNSRGMRMDYEIEEGTPSEETATKKSRKNKNRKRTKPPRIEQKPCPDSDEYSSYETIEDSRSPAANQPGGSKRKKPKPESNGKVFFEETFTDRSWESAWTYSKMEYGTEKKKFEKFYRIRSRRGNKGFDYGLVTSNKGTEDYAISATFQPFNSNDGPFIVQFALQYQTIPHCVYIYLRLFDCKFKPEELTADSPYLVQIGPNICGAEKHLSVILTDSVKGDHYDLADKVQPITSTDIHMYALIIHSDGNYQILINDKAVQNGSITTSFPNYQGYSSICAVGLNIWHSVLDKFFKGQIILDDILISSDMNYAEKKRVDVLGIIAAHVNTTNP